MIKRFCDKCGKSTLGKIVAICGPTMHCMACYHELLAN